MPPGGVGSSQARCAVSRPSKYDPLERWLSDQTGDRVAASFADLDQLIGGLPPSARNYDPYWYGSAIHAPTHVWKRAWERGGFRVETVDRRTERVVFQRLPRKQARAEAILSAAGLQAATRAASGDYLRSEDFAAGVRYCATAHVRDQLDLFGVQFHGATAMTAADRLEPVLLSVGLVPHGHRGGQRTFFRAFPSIDDDVDSDGILLTRWAITGIVGNA
jgi:hypothetical protein